MAHQFVPMDELAVQKMLVFPNQPTNRWHGKVKVTSPSAIASENWLQVIKWEDPIDFVRLHVHSVFVD